MLMMLEPMHSPILRRKADIVEFPNESLNLIVTDLWETMWGNNGVGLAAPQVGLPFQIAVANIAELWSSAINGIVMINPIVTKLGIKEVKGEEACLSIPGVSAVVYRHEKIKLNAQNLEGTPYEIELKGWPARIVQHEVDHLNGILFIDYLSEFKRKEIFKRVRQL